jgi:hypothetical protein
MTSVAPGQNISPTEVTKVSNRELFVPFEHFPWFRDASIGAITNVELPSAHHLYWPDLDVDLAVESIEHPEKYPLVSRVRLDKTPQPVGDPSA